jgi:hypothetical protein
MPELGLQQAQAQPTHRVDALTPEEKMILKDLYWRSTEAYSRTFLPLALVNRPLVIQHLRGMKDDIDRLVKVL